MVRYIRKVIRMATSETTSKYRVSAKFNNGLDQSGNVKTFSVSLGTLSLTGYTNAAAMAVVAALEPCYSQSLYTVEKTTTSALSEE